MYLFDTNIVSELRKLPGGRCCEPVKLWASQVDASTSYLSVVTILEIELGILQVNRRDAAQGAILRRWFDGSMVCGIIMKVELSLSIQWWL